MLDKVGKNPVACNDLDDPKLNRFSLLDGNVSDDENTLNNPEDNDDFIIKGLSEMALGSLSSEKDDANLYLAKGPMFRRNEVASSRAAPYELNSSTLKAAAKEIERIPYLPDTNVSHPNEEYVKNMDQFYNSKNALTEPRLFLKKGNGELHGLSMAVNVTLNVGERKIGIQLPRILVPEGVLIEQGLVDIMLQPNSRDQRFVAGKAQVLEATDDPETNAIFIEPQFLELSPFVIGGLSSVEYLLDGVTEEDLQNAISLVGRQDSFDLLKTYGPNKDTMLMALCCKKDDTPMIRAQVYALCGRILSMPESVYRQNVVLKNDSGLSALDYTTVTNNSRLAVFLAELFYILGQDILGRDNSGNTIIHVMARKGDSVSSCLEALFLLRFRHGVGGKVYNSNLVNSKNFLPIHIAAMSSKSPQNILRILLQDYAHSLDCRTSDGSLPLHLACQYSSDPCLLGMILSWNKSSNIDERRNDGFTPLHLVTARNDEKDLKVGLIQLDENTQLQMMHVLLGKGADKNLTVENYRPVDLLKPTRTEAISLLLNNINSMKTEIGNPMMCCYADSPDSLASLPGEQSPEDAFQGHEYYNSDTDSSPNMGSQWQSSPYRYHYSPGAHVGSVSSGVESHYSDESDEDNNCGADIDAIAQVLIGHPSIQAAIEAATRFE